MFYRVLEAGEISMELRKTCDLLGKPVAGGMYVIRLIQCI